AGTPVGAACVLALRGGADAGTAARTEPAGTPVDVPCQSPPLDRPPHRRVGGLEHGPQLGVVHLLETPPRRDARLPEGLGLPDVPDPGHEPLVEECVADLSPGIGAQAREHRPIVGRLTEDVGAKARSVARQVTTCYKLENRPVPED